MGRLQELLPTPCDLPFCLILVQHDKTDKCIKSKKKISDFIMPNCR